MKVRELWAREVKEALPLRFLGRWLAPGGPNQQPRLVEKAAPPHTLTEQNVETLAAP